MFTAILGNLTSLLPRSFIFGSYIPVLIVGFMNFAMLYWASPWVREHAQGAYESSAVLTTAVLFVSSIVVAYVISSLQNVMRATLEGKYLPNWVASPLRARQKARLDALESDMKEARSDSDQIDEKAPAWRAAMYSSAGRDLHLTRRPTGYRDNPEPHASIDRLGRRRAAWLPIHWDMLNDASAKMAGALTAYDANAIPDLKRDRETVYEAIKYAAPAAKARQLELFARRQTEFGLSYIPAPTRLGNVAASLQSYARIRYRIDIDTFWGRLQPVIQKNDEKAYTALIDSKTQLDFLVACCWGSALSTIVWLVLLAFFGDVPLAVIVTLAVGVATVRVLYGLSVSAYVAYTQFVRACLDLNRFELLRSLHIPLPGGIRDERALWEALERVSSFGSENVELSYQHERQP